MSTDEVQNNKIHLLGKLTASLIHEIRNPLSVIKLNLDLVKMLKDEVTDEVMESVNDCSEATDRIEYMVDNLLTFARKGSLSSENLSINKVTLNAINLLEVKATKHMVNINYQLDETDPTIYIDENRLLQVLLNLITNAIESCEDSGKINIKTFSISNENKNYVIWEIKDDGVGISMENKTKIFRDFYTSKENGTGLGLSVCQMILKQFDVELSFNSEVGTGTTFRMEFDLDKMRQIIET